MNLLECHMLSAMRGVYKLRIPRVRKALTTVKSLFPSPHPLVDLEFQTDRVDLFIQQLPDKIINLSTAGYRGGLESSSPTNRAGCQRSVQFLPVRREEESRGAENCRDKSGGRFWETSHSWNRDLDCRYCRSLARPGINK